MYTLYLIYANVYVAFIKWLFILRGGNMGIKEWIASTDAEEWNEAKEWWEPHIYSEGDEYYNYDNYGSYADWTCDHMGDAQEVIEAMWKEIITLRDNKK